MRLPGIGELTDMEDYWRLVYESCGHVQVLAREGLEGPERARRDVLRYYAECLLCRAAGRPVPDNLVLPPPDA
jgi:hypothetical protein